MSDPLRPHELWPSSLLCPWDFPGKNPGVGCHFLLQVIFLTQGSNPGLLHCKQTPYQLSHEGTIKFSKEQVEGLNEAQFLPIKKLLERGTASEASQRLKCLNWAPIGTRQWHPTPGFLPGKSHGRRSLVGCSPWGR